MKVLLNNKAYEINIKSELEQLIKEYHEANTQLENGSRNIIQQYKTNIQGDVYTPEYLLSQYEKSRDSLLSVALGKAKSLNAKAVQAVASVKNKAVPALIPENKPYDYAVKVNNALQFIQIEGTDITDETASRILNEFVNDAETMRLFRRVIEKQLATKALIGEGEQISNAYGLTTFPLTFGRLFHFEQFLEAFAELEEMTSQLFLNKKAQTETEFLHGVSLSVPMDSYIQLVTERNIIEQAQTIETMLVELFPVND